MKCILYWILLRFITVSSISQSQIKICITDNDTPTLRVFAHKNDTRILAANKTGGESKMDYIDNYDYFTDCVLQNSSTILSHKKIYKILTTVFVNNQFYIDLVDDVYDTKVYSRLAYSGEVQKNQLVCSLCNNQIFESRDNLQRVMCECLQWYLFPITLESYIYNGTNWSFYSADMLITVNLMEGQLLNLSLIIDLYFRNLNVTWYHTYLDVDDPEHQKYVTRIISNKILSCYPNSCMNEVNHLGIAEMSDSGEYFVTLYNLYTRKLIASSTYVVTVTSKKLHYPTLFVKDPKTNEIIQGHLRNNFLYRFTCSTQTYPWPELQINWIPSCNISDIDLDSNATVGNFTVVTGTVERIVFFESTALFTGLLTCKENYRETYGLKIVTDIDKKDYHINDEGVRLDKIPQKTYVKSYDDYVTENNPVLRLLLHKIFKKVTCYWENDACSGHYLTDSCPTMLEIEQHSFSPCSGFPSNWSTVYIDHGVEIDFVDSTIFSTKFVIRINNISRFGNYGMISCKGFSDNIDVNIGSDLITVYLTEPLKPLFLHRPEETASGFYSYNDEIRLHCSSDLNKGYRNTELFWTHNKRVADPSYGFSRLDKCDYESYLCSTMNFKIKEPADFGEYCCILSNRIGTNISCMNVYYFPTDSISLDNLRITVISTLTIFAIMFLIITPTTFVRKMIKNEKLKIDQVITEIDNGEPDIPLEPVVNEETGEIRLDQIRLNSKLEIPLQGMQRSSQLGCGNFGIVFKARLNGIDADLAVKTVKDKNNSEQRECLMNELKYLIYVGHHDNILCLVGFCTDNLPDDFYVFVEYCHFGSLDDFLYKCRDVFIDERLNCPSATTQFNTDNDDTFASESTEFTVTTSDLLSYSYQVANGMDYLASKGVVHRDLALRNVLLNKDRHIKISDFGLSRDSYYYMKFKGQALPQKWMALESVKDGKFSSKSDVWSFGIVLWEMFSLAEEPYSDLPFDESLFRWLTAGNRLASPRYSPEPLYDLMKDCWKSNPADRPNFQQCKLTIQKVFDDFSLVKQAIFMENFYPQASSSSDRPTVDRYFKC